LAAVQLAKQKRAKAFNVDTPGTRAECFKYLESLLLDKTFGVAAEGMRSGKRKKLNFLHQLISVSTKRSSSSCFERVTNKTNIRKMFSSLPPSEKLKFRTFYAKLKEQVPVYFFLSWSLICQLQLFCVVLQIQQETSSPELETRFVAVESMLRTGSRNARVVESNNKKRRREERLLVLGGKTYDSVAKSVRQGGVFLNRFRQIVLAAVAFDRDPEANGELFRVLEPSIAMAKEVLSLKRIKVPVKEEQIFKKFFAVKRFRAVCFLWYFHNK